jgi:FkbM family methyltransferase
MKKVRLSDGTVIHCLRKSEAVVLDDHVKGYLKNGIELKEGDTVVDIGANIGVMGYRLSQWYPGIIIHSFEPVEPIWQVLKANSVKSGNSGFYAHHIGVGSKNEELTLTYFPKSPALSTFNPQMWEDDPGAFRRAVKGSIRNSPDSMRYARRIPNFLIPLIAWYLKSGRQELKCRITTLSDFIRDNNVNRIDLLKIDCEGHEWEVIKGIDDVHWPMIRAVVMEVHDIDGRLKQAEQFLTEKGFGKLVTEKEKSLEDTALVNLFAVR